MQEDIAVYEALRSHILQKEVQITNETIYMYVSYFALITVGSIWNNWISLFSFVVLIVFQSMINEEEWEINKASVYIKTFFETQRNDIHWESLHKYQLYSSMYLSTIRKSIGWYILKYSATVLSILSCISTLLPILHSCNYQIFNISFIHTVRLVLAILLGIVTFYINRQYFSIREGEKLKNQLAAVINEFYKNSRKNISE